MLDLPILAVTYCVLLAGLFIALWIWYDRRDHRRFERERRKRAFHCKRCAALYAGATGDETGPCPRCGQVNPRLRF